MTKKPLIACLAMLGLLIMGKLFLFSIDDQSFAATKGPLQAGSNDTYMANLQFADEYLPLSQVDVHYRMKKILASYDYHSLQSYKLHRQALRWFPVMEPILTKYGIPEDFKYIPLVESGLKSGTSQKGASGLWQFMPHTARAYGLKVNARVDERHEIEKATIAACRYLRFLHQEFNNWTLVAAAYNIGENRLKRIMNQQDEDDYFQMKLNRETASYVYKLVAMKEIIERPAIYGYYKVSSPMAINVNDQRLHTEYFVGDFSTQTESSSN